MYKFQTCFRLFSMFVSKKITDKKNDQELKDKKPSSQKKELPTVNQKKIQALNPSK